MLCYLFLKNSECVELFYVKPELKDAFNLWEHLRRPKRGVSEEELYYVFDFSYWKTNTYNATDGDTQPRVPISCIY